MKNITYKLDWRYIWFAVMLLCFGLLIYLAALDVTRNNDATNKQPVNHITTKEFNLEYSVLDSVDYQKLTIGPTKADTIATIDTLTRYVILLSKKNNKKNTSVYAP